jgi:hypothetical protein
MLGQVAKGCPIPSSPGLQDPLMGVGLAHANLGRALWQVNLGRGLGHATDITPSHASRLWARKAGMGEQGA